jgi:pilus assembly protein CpaF
MKNYEEIKQKIRNQIIKEVQSSTSKIEKDDWVQEQIDEAILKESKEVYFPLEEKRKMSKQIFYELRRLPLIQELLEEEDITEIMVHGTENIFIEKNGNLYLWKKHFTNVQVLEDMIQRMVAGCNRVVNEANPIVDARLMDGSRVNVMLPPVAINGPIVTIRKFSKNSFTMDKLISMEAISKEVAEFLKTVVIAGYNILISGGTGSGKTTFLNALSQYIPKDERIITIEDSAELQLQNHINLVRLETRNANVEGCNSISIQALMKASLRMRPDRIIVGEVRGEEAVDMIQAMNTGHDGSLSTGHANSAKDMLSRLETMMLMGVDLPLHAIRRQIVSGIDILVHLGRLRDKSRKLLEIVEIKGLEAGEISLRTLYQFKEKGKGSHVIGTWERTNDLIRQEKLRRAGL